MSGSPKKRQIQHGCPYQVSFMLRSKCASLQDQTKPFTIVKLSGRSVYQPFPLIV